MSGAVVEREEVSTTLAAISDPHADSDAGTIADVLSRVSALNEAACARLLARHRIDGSTPLVDLSEEDRLKLIHAIVKESAWLTRKASGPTYSEAADSEDLERALQIVKAGPKWRDNIGPWYDGKRLARAIHVSVDKAAQMAESGELIELETADHVIVFPAFQFYKGAVVHEIVDAHARLVGEGRMSAWTAASWLMTADERLDGESVRDWFLRVQDLEKLNEMITEDITPYAA